MTKVWFNSSSKVFLNHKNLFNQQLVWQLIDNSHFVFAMWDDLVNHLTFSLASVQGLVFHDDRHPFMMVETFTVFVTTATNNLCKMLEEPLNFVFALGQLWAMPLWRHPHERTHQHLLSQHKNHHFNDWSRIDWNFLHSALRWSVEDSH